MESFASAYARALFPRRYGHRPGTSAGGHPGPGRQPMGLAPGDFDISLGAAIYRMVGAIERLLDSGRRLAARRRARRQPRPGTTPVGCG